jgi:hypothetical protein
VSSDTEAQGSRHGIPGTVQRLTRVVAVALLAAGVFVWLRPVDVPGQNFQPFGCGTPASPMAGQLAEAVCADALAGWRILALCLVVAAAVVLAVGEVVVPRAGAWSAAAGVGAVLGVPLLALAAWRVTAPVTAYGADGGRAGCGTPLHPTTDPLAAGICASLPQEALSGGVGLALAGLIAVLGAGYVLRRRDTG